MGLKQSIGGQGMKRGKRAFYRKLPVAIEAFQWFSHSEDEPEDHLVRYFRHPNFKGDQVCDECGNEFHVHGYIDTMEGGHRVCPKDWIIRGVAGEYYPCKPDIFEMTYESADKPNKPEGGEDE